MLDGHFRDLVDIAAWRLDYLGQTFYSWHRDHENGIEVSKDNPGAS